MALYLGIAALALAAGTAVYQGHENKSNEEKASANLPQPKPPIPPSGGLSTQAALQNQQQTQQQGGSFLSPQQGQAISNQPNAQKKSLLGA